MIEFFVQFYEFLIKGFTDFGNYLKDQRQKLKLGLNAQPEIEILKVIYYKESRLFNFLSNEVLTTCYASSEATEK